MIKRRTLIPTIFAVALFALSVPAMVAAQGSYDPYGGYYGGGRNDRRDNNRYGYDQRRLRESVRRLDNMSGDFQRHLDSALDHSRYDDSRREDRINDVARDFSNATDNLKDRYDDGKNINRSSNEARRVLQLGSVLNAFMNRNRLGGRAESDWARIRQDLNVVASAYGFNMADFDNRDYRNNDNRGSNNYPRNRGVRRTNYPW